MVPGGTVTLPSEPSVLRFITTVPLPLFVVLVRHARWSRKAACPAGIVVRACPQQSSVISYDLRLASSRIGLSRNMKWLHRKTLLSPEDFEAVRSGGGLAGLASDGDRTLEADHAERAAFHAACRPAA